MMKSRINQLFTIDPWISYLCSETLLNFTRAVFLVTVISHAFDYTESIALFSGALTVASIIAIIAPSFISHIIDFKTPHFAYVFSVSGYPIFLFFLLFTQGILEENTYVFVLYVIVNFFTVIQRLCSQAVVPTFTDKSLTQKNSVQQIFVQSGALVGLIFAGFFVGSFPIESVQLLCALISFLSAILIGLQKFPVKKISPNLPSKGFLNFLKQEKSLFFYLIGSGMFYVWLTAFTVILPLISGQKDLYVLAQYVSFYDFIFTVAALIISVVFINLYDGRVDEYKLFLSLHVMVIFSFFILYFANFIVVKTIAIFFFSMAVSGCFILHTKVLQRSVNSNFLGRALAFRSVTFNITIFIFTGLSGYIDTNYPHYFDLYLLAFMTLVLLVSAFAIVLIKTFYSHSLENKIINKEKLE